MGHVFLAWLGLIVAYLLTRLAEFRVHRVNYDFLIFAGGEEILAQRMRIFYMLGFAVIPMSALEYYAGLSAAATSTMQILGLTMVFAALNLRLWAMRSLGHRWSMRCVFVSGYPKADRGPYKYLKHPEYLSRYAEGVGLCLFLGSLLSAGVFTVLFWTLARSIVMWEERQLVALSVDLQESIR